MHLNVSPVDKHSVRIKEPVITEKSSLEQSSCNASLVYPLLYSLSISMSCSQCHPFHLEDGGSKVLQNVGIMPQPNESVTLISSIIQSYYQSKTLTKLSVRPPTLTTRPSSTLYVKGSKASSCVNRGNVSEAAIQFMSCSHDAAGKIFTSSSQYGMLGIVGSLEQNHTSLTYLSLNLLETLEILLCKKLTVW